MPTVWNKKTGKFPKGTVFIGRPSEWGNRHRLGTDGDREEVVHQHWLDVHRSPKLIQKIQRELVGKDLLCFCAPETCHGDTLVRIANAPKKILVFKDEFRFLSNFYPCQIVVKRFGKSWTFGSSEHLYQSLKTIDPTEANWVRKASSCKEARERGNQITLRKDWGKATALRAMMYATRGKYKQNLDLLRRLVDTLKAELVEGNWWGDTFWGVCNGRGYNYLGKTLMTFRAQEVRAIRSI